MAAMQAQIQALLTVQRGGGTATGTNAGSQIEVAKPAIFNGEAERVGGFVSACKIYIRNKLRGETVEGQVQWALSYVQGGSADVWKENLMEELENGEIEYESIEEFFTSLKKEVWRRRRGVGKGGRIEKVGARREDDGGIHAGVQKSSQGKWIRGAAIDRRV